MSPLSPVRILTVSSTGITKIRQGSHTTVELQQAGYNVVIVDDLSNSKIEVLDGIEKITGIRPAFEQVDLRDKAANVPSSAICGTSLPCIASCRILFLRLSFIVVFNSSNWF